MPYGEPRAPRDVDLVVELPRRDIARLQSRFPNADFYLSPQAAAALLQVAGDEIDRERVTAEAERLGLRGLWEAVLRRVEEAGD
jgi:hypothetical protein